MKLNKFLLGAVCLSFFGIKPLTAQSQKKIVKTNPLKISGYIQTQIQFGGQHTKFNVGNNQTTDKFRFAYGIRRGRLKFTYQKSFYRSVFHINLTESKLSLREAHLDLLAPSKELRGTSLTFGVFDLPFGFENTFFSSKRPSVERASIIGTLFPNHNDWGAKLKLHSELDLLKNWNLTFAAVSGNAIKSDIKDPFMGAGTDNSVNLLSRLQYKYRDPAYYFDFDFGLSHYLGSRRSNGTVYKLENEVYTPTNADYAKREYFGADMQVYLRNLLGDMNIYTEYIFAKQPTKANSLRSPYNDKELSALYKTQIQGGYVMLEQGFQDLDSPISLVFKAEWLDRNVELKDQNTYSLGTGLIYTFNPQLRMQLYYAKNLEDKVNIPNDLFTARLQLRF